MKGNQKISELRVNIWVLLPLAMAIVLRLVAELFPPDEVWGHMGHSIGMSAWPWLCLFAPFWALLARVRLGRWTWTMIVAIASLPLAGFPLLPGDGEGQPVLVANVNAYIPGRKDLSDAFESSGAEVVVQVEARVQQIPGFLRRAHNFDDQVSRPSHYTAIFCREGVRCDARITEEFGAKGMVMPLAMVRLEGNVCLMGTHGPPPVPFNIAGLMPYMKRIADSIDKGRLVIDWAPCLKGDPVIVAGDMNAVPGSWATRLFEDKGLTDPLAWKGVFATTWPAGGDWINLPLMQLDHVWVGDVEVDDVRTVRLPGSDHKGLFFRIKRGD